MTRPGKIEWNADHGPAENARDQMPKLAAEYFAEVRGVLARDPAPEELHALRLASKRLRYTLDLFRSCYGSGLDARLNALKQVQDLLGECNDAVAAQSLVAKALRGRRAEKAQMLRHMKERAGQKAEEFRRHWTEEFDASGREEWWTRYLVRARAPHE